MRDHQLSCQQQQAANDDDYNALVGNGRKPYPLGIPQRVLDEAMRDLARRDAKESKPDVDTRCMTQQDVMGAANDRTNGCIGALLQKAGEFVAQQPLASPLGYAIRQVEEAVRRQDRHWAALQRARAQRDYEAFLALGQMQQQAMTFVQPGTAVEIRNDRPLGAK